MEPPLSQLLYCTNDGGKVLRPNMVYLDLAEKLVAQIKSGEIPPGSRLPTHRAFAEQNGVALATATRAYKTLKQRSFIVGERGRGMFVRNPELPLTLGIEQFEDAPPVDLVFNMPADPGDGDVLRSGLRWLARRGDLNSVLRYQPHGGVLSERRTIAAYLSNRVGKIDAENLFITSGAQHGLSIVALGLLKRGDIVATDQLTYPGFRAVVGLRDLSLHSVAEREGSMNPESLLRLCKTKSVRAVYLTPTVHNPLGSVMDEKTRREIVAVARHFDLLIIEDGAYDFLETDPPPSFLQLAPERSVYIGGVSKVLATGLRLGYIVVPPDLAGAVTMAIRATTWNTPAVITALVTHWIEDGSILEFENRRREAGARGQRLCQEYLNGYDICSHQYASFTWVRLPKRKRADPIVAMLADRGVAVSSAEPYAVPPGTDNALRLAFGGISEEGLRLSLKSICKVVDMA
ncbi:PLP-dependent aminotransferase family protein [uncultured Tateyamaria sp.]|nr:PLP-dependent aminotransferase family protein [uncultured Tateyamaria sp.]